MDYLDDWHDYFRVGLFLMSLWCCITLLRRYVSHAGDWTDKTKDYWYSLFLWSIAGCLIPIQGILLDLPLNPALVITTAAVLVTGRGLNRAGGWGGNA